MVRVSPDVAARVEGSASFKGSFSSRVLRNPDSVLSQPVSAHVARHEGGAWSPVSQGHEYEEQQEEAMLVC